MASPLGHCWNSVRSTCDTEGEGVAASQQEGNRAPSSSLLADIVTKQFDNDPPMRLSVIQGDVRISRDPVLWLLMSLFPGLNLDVVKVFRYRPMFFGAPFCDLAHTVMRGPSEWSIGQRELFGAFVSKLNQCVF
jgi:hypothetical protein